MSEIDFLLVGLGNPGVEYEMTRHNVGFQVIDELQKVWRCGEFVRKWNADYSTGSFTDKKIHLIKPMTFMNRSGQAVASFCKFYKLAPERIVVVHDDLDMMPGRVKLVKGGGAGGHNGIKSIMQSLGEKDFYRLKYGIGRPGQGDVHPDFPVEKYVLGKYSKSELSFFSERLPLIVEGLEIFLRNGPSQAMNILNVLK